jgi:hypothetical protein
VLSIWIARLSRAADGARVAGSDSCLVHEDTHTEKRAWPVMSATVAAPRETWPAASGCSGGDRSASGSSSSSVSRIRKSLLLRSQQCDQEIKWGSRRAFAAAPTVAPVTASSRRCRRSSERFVNHVAPNPANAPTMAPKRTPAGATTSLHVRRLPSCCIGLPIFRGVCVVNGHLHKRAGREEEANGGEASDVVDDLVHQRRRSRTVPSPWPPASPWVSLELCLVAPS